MIFVDLMGTYTFPEALKIGITSFCDHYPALQPFHVQVSKGLSHKLAQLSQFPWQDRFIRVSQMQSAPYDCESYYFARILASLIIFPWSTPQVDELLIISGEEKPAC